MIRPRSFRPSVTRESKNFTSSHLSPLTIGLTSLTDIRKDLTTRGCMEVEADICTYLTIPHCGKNGTRGVAQINFRTIPGSSFGIKEGSERDEWVFNMRTVSVRTQCRGKEGDSLGIEGAPVSSDGCRAGWV